MRIPAVFKGVSEVELQRHFAFACRALRDRGSLHVRPRSASGPVILCREVRKSSSGHLTLRVSSGYVGRANVVKACALLDSRGIVVRRRLTPKRSQLRDVQVRYPASDVLAGRAFLADLSSVAGAMGASEPFIFDLTYWGPFDPACQPQPDDPVQPGRAFKAGYKIGQVLSQVVGTLRK